jgi:hypothetical protein
LISLYLPKEIYTESKHHISRYYHLYVSLHKNTVTYTRSAWLMIMASGFISTSLQLQLVITAHN